jgi:hypothetical protein
MKYAILECLYIFLSCTLCGSFFFLIECPALLQNTFFAMMVAPTLWFIPQRILIEMKK